MCEGLENERGEGRVITTPINIPDIGKFVTLLVGSLVTL